jgi:hypothetical protein
VQVDGKVARSARLLVARPGALTAEYLAGRRAHYVSPVKIYLLCSAFFFFVNAVTPAPPPRVGSDGRIKGGIMEGMTTGLLGRPVDTKGDTSAAGRQILDARARSYARVRSDPEGFRRRVESVAPQAMFVLLPITALLLALAFRGAGIHYPQHLVFTLHLQAFFFLAFATQMLIGRIVPYRVSGYLLLTALFASVAYLLLAAHRVYRRGLVSILLRGAVVTAGYTVLWVLVLSLSVAIIASTY